MVDKYHLTENGPKPCSAHIRSCPVGGAHFDTKDEAEHAYELEMGEREGFFKKLKRSSGLDPYTRHIAKANLRIAAEERDLKRRDERQNGGRLSTNSSLKEFCRLKNSSSASLVKSTLDRRESLT